MRTYRFRYMPARFGEPDPRFTVRARNEDEAWMHCPQCQLCRAELDAGYVECSYTDPDGDTVADRLDRAHPALTACAAEWWCIRVKHRRKRDRGRPRWR